MSYISPEQTAYKDSANLDAFGRLRVSTGAQLFGLSQEYSNHPLVWDSYTASGGTATWSALRNSTALTTAGTTSGARALRQTKMYFRYTPGKSQLIKMTAILQKGAVPSGTAFSAVGYYDDNNGLFFKQSAAGVYVVERSGVSGSVVDNPVLQASWNIDKFDGNGPSGKTIDWTKTQIFMIDMQWLGAGRVRYGLDIDGVLYYCHQFIHANTLDQIYMETADLPLRYEVFNSGGAGSNISLESICSSVESEGGIQENSVYPFSYSAYVDTPLSISTTMRPLVTRRLRSTFNGKTVRGVARLNSFGLRVGSNDIYWEISFNQTVTLGAGGSTVTGLVNSAYSISEYDTYVGANNTVSGGSVIFNGFALSGAGGSRGLTLSPGANTVLQIGKNYAGVSDSYTLSARSTASTATVSVVVQLEETY